MDPVIHMIFKAIAGRLREVNDRINNVSEMIISDLACRIFFDGLLHPVPASTILKYNTNSTQTDIDDFTEACWVNTAVKPSLTFYFSPVQPKSLYPIEAVVALARNGEGGHVLWIDPQWSGKSHILGSFNPSGDKDNLDRSDCLYIGLKSSAEDNKTPATDLFMLASPELMGLLRWGRWSYMQTAGIFSKPEIISRTNLKKIEQKKSSPELSLWGHTYYPIEHIEEYSDSFFDIPKGFTGSPPVDMHQAFSGQDQAFWDDFEPLHWIKVEFDRRVPSSLLKSFKLAATNCLVAINSHFQKQNFFYHGPGPMAVELQSPAREIYEIISITDNRGRFYSNVYASDSNVSHDCRFIPRIIDENLQLMIIPPPGGPAPDRFSVEYKTSTDQAANGIAPGNINSLYNPHPGIESVINLTTSQGGVKARTFEEMLEAFPRVLRSHNRAISSSDFESLALAYDKRIKSARAKPGSTVRNGVLYRCIILEANLGNYKFEPAEEGGVFLARLQKYLEARSPMGTVVKATLA
jgi:hypothetical protein